MAFGKDPSHLNNIGAFGGNPMQRGRSAARRPTRSGGGFSSVFYWANNFTPSLSPGYDTVRFIPAEYKQLVTHDGKTASEEVLPYVKYIEHYNGEKGCICSAGAFFGVRDKAQPCPSCDKFWENVRENKALKAQGLKPVKRMSADDRFAWTIFDYAYYFEVPQLTAEGQYKMDPKTNQPYMRWEKGNPQDPRFQGRQFKEGQVIAWSMSKPIFDIIAARDKMIANCCKSCGNREGIVCTAKYCPGCNGLVYNPQSTTLSLEDQQKIDDNIFNCPNCKRTGYLAEQIACRTCPNPARASLFDVDMQVQMTKTGKNDNKTLQILGWELRPMQVKPEVLPTIQPLDLLKKFGPTDPATQKNVMKIADAPPQQMPQQGPSQFAGQYQQPYQQPVAQQWGGQPLPPMQQFNPQMAPQQPMPQQAPQQFIQPQMPQAAPQQPAFIPYQQPAPQQVIEAAPQQYQMPAPQVAAPAVPQMQFPQGFFPQGGQGGQQ